MTYDDNIMTRRIVSRGEGQVHFQIYLFSQ